VTARRSVLKPYTIRYTLACIPLRSISPAILELAHLFKFTRSTDCVDRTFGNLSCGIPRLRQANLGTIEQLLGLWNEVLDNEPAGTTDEQRLQRFKNKLAERTTLTHQAGYSTLAHVMLTLWTYDQQQVPPHQQEQ